MYQANFITQQKALIFRIIHRENLNAILASGMISRRRAGASNYVDIGNVDLIGKRHTRSVPTHSGTTLSDFVPFYFTPFSPMMFNIYTGYSGVQKRANEEIYIAVSSLPNLVERQCDFVFTDRHAYLATASFHTSLDDLHLLPWDHWRARDFKRDPNDSAKIERYQAETLVYDEVPNDCIIGLVCVNNAEKERIEGACSRAGVPLQPVVRPGWYF